MNETITALIIYDNTGRVWGIYQGETEVPAGLQSFIANVLPKPIKEISLDMTTTPPTPNIVYGNTLEDTESEVTNLQDVVIELEARVAELEG